MLIPRPETRQLCDLLRSRGYLFDGAIVADVCTGSGAIALFTWLSVWCYGQGNRTESHSPFCQTLTFTSVSVDLRAEDILSDDFTPKYPEYDLVVSNPSLYPPSRETR